MTRQIWNYIYYEVSRYATLPKHEKQKEMGEREGKKQERKRRQGGCEKRTSCSTKHSSVLIGVLEGLKARWTGYRFNESIALGYLRMPAATIVQ